MRNDSSLYFFAAMATCAMEGFRFATLEIDLGWKVRDEKYFLDDYIDICIFDIRYVAQCNSFHFGRMRHVHN